MKPIAFKPLLQHLMTFALMLSPVTGSALDLEEILELNARAHGGSDKWAKIQNVRVELTISEPGFEVDGLYLATRDGRMRIDIEVDGQRVFSEGFDGEKAWQWTPGKGVEWQDEKSAAALKHGIELPGRFYTIRDLAEAGHKVSLAAPVEEEGLEFWVVTVQLQDGFSRDYFIEKESFKTLRERDVRAFHPAIDATLISVETRYSHEHWVDGVLKFRRSENINHETGEWLGTTIVRSVRQNVELTDVIFEPGELVD